MAANLYPPCQLVVRGIQGCSSPKLPAPASHQLAEKAGLTSWNLAQSYLLASLSCAELGTGQPQLVFWIFTSNKGLSYQALKWYCSKVFWICGNITLSFFFNIHANRVIIFTIDLSRLCLVSWVTASTWFWAGLFICLFSSLTSDENVVARTIFASYASVVVCTRLSVKEGQFQQGTPKKLVESPQCLLPNTRVHCITGHQYLFNSEKVCCVLYK